MAFFALTIFASAFLLFLVQPLIAKFILPWFGGSAAVWTTCMLFFQVFLLAGYAYAHAVTKYLPARAQAALHTVLLLAAVASLPIIPGAQWKPDSANAPVARILELLAVCLGLPYFMLSTTGPLLQAWFVKLRPGVQPYKLYALSNTGSLLALVSFPFLIEPTLTRRTQANTWACCFGIFVLLCVGCAWLLWRHNPSPVHAASTGEKTADSHQPDRKAGDKLLWFLLPMCSSVLLLATTNKLCLDVASFPFLWVLPLTLYLITFILCFDRPAWYARKTFVLLLIPAFASIFWALYKGNDLTLAVQIEIYCGAMAVGCMVCHGEVYRLKPPPRSLTSFYLLIAAGGAAGGVFVAAIAPVIFESYAELSCGLWLVAALVCFIHFRERSAWKIGRLPLPLWPASLAIAITLGIMFLRQNQADPKTVTRSRNFYAALRVLELRKQDPDTHAYQLVNGNIDHGLQLLKPAYTVIPMTYYNDRSGVGLAMTYFASRTNCKVGIVGLGAGTLAAYGRPGNIFRFYELNPDVLRIADTWFSYLKESKAHVDVVPGDARLSLEREQPQNFDLLVLDAFSSDSIPIHLLTREAFDTYARHLKPDGAIAVHVSNQHLDLIPVVIGAMDHLNMDMVYIHWDHDPMPFGLHPSSWLLMSHNQEFLRSKEVFSRTERPESVKPIIWTDDYASLLPLLKR